MPDPAPQRFPCPHCGKVLKTRADWAGRAATCPTCGQPFTVPAAADGAPASPRTLRQLEPLVAPDAATLLEDAAADDLALYLSQGTCRDYALGAALLAGRALPARQWRRILASAAAQENLRLKIDDLLAGDQPLPDDATPIPLLVAADDTAPNAWTLLARYLYFVSHGTCEACHDDPTGMSCVYLTFAGMLAARAITPDRPNGWHAAIRQTLGL